QVIQVDVAGRYAAGGLSMLGAEIDARISLVQSLLQRHRVAGQAELSDVENPALGGVQELVGGLDQVLSIFLDFGAGVDEVADDGLVANDAGVILGVGGAGGGIPQLGEVDIAASLFQELFFPQIIGQRDGVRLSAGKT